MTDNLSALAREEFIAVWNAAATVNEVASQVCERVGRVPRWAVLARAVALRRAGVKLKRFADPTDTRAPSHSQSD